jgi:release factor glutamine methyltransferase
MAAEPRVARAVTWAAAIDAAAGELRAAGCETPRLDAELLLAAALGVTRTALFLTPGAALNGRIGSRFDALVARRAAREPVAYILGVKHFRRLALAVDGRALIPRPETELLVEACLAGARPASRVVDVGTGSGAVALAVKDERPDLDVIGVDVSADAVALARENAERLGLEVRFAVGDLLSGFPAGAIDAVVANLPYVADADPLPPEIARYEPAGALFAGADGLDCIRRLCDSPLAGVSLLALEHGLGQSAAVAALVAGAGFGGVRSLPDLAGIDRVVVGRRR